MTGVPERSAALEHLLNTRYSCRGFLPKPVPEAVIDRILSLAQRTASWTNAQPWKLIVTSGAATEKFREAIYAHAASSAPKKTDFVWPREYRGETQARRRACGFGLYGALGIAREDMAAREHQHLENYRFFGAPHVAIVTSDEALGTYGAVDVGAYVGNFMLAATSLGVATIAQAALSTYPDFIRAHFGLPTERAVVCGISFGYEDPAHPANKFRTTRADLGEVVTRVNE